MKRLKNLPLPVPIPLDLAKFLGVSDSFISHCNSGRKPVPLDMAIKVMELGLRDKRLDGLGLLDMVPELKPTIPFLCRAKQARKRKKAKNHEL